MAGTAGRRYPGPRPVPSLCRRSPTAGSRPRPHAPGPDPSLPRSRRCRPAGPGARRLEQQRLIAEFGLFALRTQALQPILDEAARLAAEGLGTRFAKVLEHRAAAAPVAPDRAGDAAGAPGEGGAAGARDGGTLLLRAGVGWAPGLVGEATVGADLASPAGYALRTGRPVVSNHLGGEGRFRTPRLMADHGIRRAINVIVRGEGPPFGVLEADSPEPGEFAPRDAHFLQALANTLAVAIEKEAARGETEARQALMLREGHHRVKNSLQLVSTMLGLQARAAAGPEGRAVRDALEDAARRIVAIGAVHDQLYRSADLETVELCGYLEGLTAELRRAVAGGADRAVTVACGPARWPADRVAALGVVVTELVTNAIKHAGGPVTVRFEPGPDGSGRLTVEDRGAGLPEGFEPERGTGLGMRLVVAMLRGQHGRLVIDRAAGHGRLVAEFGAPPRAAES